VVKSGKDKKQSKPGQRSIKIDARTDDVLNDFNERTGRAKSFVLGRLAEWFLSLPDDVKPLVIERIDDGERAEKIRAVLERMAKYDPHASASDSVNGAA
jgi:hypothetical protein